ncbi:MAG TPA: hypothetical protein VM617_08720 [Thermoanaerobaculia bacterium]|nr:hypothetical protein [Thermoanaerobaculia bacterium]
MLDDILGELVGEAAFGRLGRSRRAQLVFRLLFGLLGAFLGLGGAIHFLRQPPDTTNVAMHLSMVALFVSLACFSLFNVGMARRWKWPGLCFVASFVALFATRILFGP